MAAKLRRAVTTSDGFAERLVWFWSNPVTVAATRAPCAPFVGLFERRAIRAHLAAARHTAALLGDADDRATAAPDALAQAATALLLGGAVKGGRVLGDWPGLRDLHGCRDLRPANDVRGLLAGVLAAHWGVEDAFDWGDPAPRSRPRVSQPRRFSQRASATSTSSRRIPSR